MRTSLQELLKKINKTKKEHELNCGACGYQTCRDKAAAVYNGLSNIYTCLPYMNDIAEKMNQNKFGQQIILLKFQIRGMDRLAKLLLNMILSLPCLKL